MNLTPETDREIYISLNNEVQKLRETIERFGAALLNLENNKFNNHEQRIETLEKIETERRGMWKLFIVIQVIIAITIGVLTIKAFMN